MRVPVIALLSCAMLFTQSSGGPRVWRSSANHDEIKLRDTPDNGWVFCRLIFHSNRSEAGGSGWTTDYPGAERRLTIRLSETTTIRTVERGGHPVHWLADPASPISRSRCPWMMANDVGTLVWEGDEAAGMRDWFARGGFLWVDDFWGRAAWDQWIGALSHVLPGARIAPIHEDHVIFRLAYRVSAMPQVSNMPYWHSRRGETSERGAESPSAETWGAWDVEGHLAVLMTFNTDIGDTWEREYDPEYFAAFAADGYAVAANVILYAMTH